MAFMKLIMTTSKLNKLKKELIEEKTDAIKISQKKPTKKRLRHYIINLHVTAKRFLKKALSCFFFEKFCYTLRHDGSCENYTLKSIVGFICGFVLTYIFFMFSVFQLNFSLPTATVFCSFLGCILMIGLAFSSKVRCVVLLTLPQFFSQKGRQALLAYAFILAISGPAKNTLNNMGILSESLACGQEQLKQAVRQIIDVIKKPFLAIKEAIKKVVKTVKEIVKKIKEILLTIKRIIMAILKVIKAAFQFLAKIINICNKEVGTPFERCTRVFENAIIDCNAKLGPLFNWLCSLAYIVQSVCYTVKFLDLICLIVDFINDSVIGVVVRKVKTFVRHIRTMFYVRMSFSHSFQFQTNSSKTMHQIAHEIVGEIKHRTRVIRAIFEFMTSAAALFFLFIIIKVTYYRFKFLTSERFDNKYINKDFREIDIRRAKLGKETVLPLNDREKMNYVTVTSKTLAKSEKKALAKAASTLATASLKLAIYMAADYSLFWILNLIKYYGKFQSKVQAPNMPTVHIAGNGFLADLLRSIVKAFQPVGIQLEIDTVPCLPTPIPPNYDRYVQIATVILLCWVLTLLEPYGLRLRHIVMCYYYPTRAKQRTIWLYNHIMRTRNSFLKFARRQLKRKVLGDGSIAKVTCKEFLAANFKICRLCLGEGAQTCCLLCGEVFRESSNKKPIKCHTPDCPGIYCEQCFSDLQNLCTVCLSPIEYGDLSDIDEEKDSSEEEAKRSKEKKKKKNWKKWFICSKCCRKCCPDDDEEDEETVSTDKSISDGKYDKRKSKDDEKEKKDDAKERKDDGKEKKDEEKRSIYEDTDSSDEESRLLKPEDTQDEASQADGKDGDQNKTKDSDYYSSDTSTTDYSYSYQYDKSRDTQPPPLVTPFKDVEKQEVPDYASMNSFREEIEDMESKSKEMLDKETETAQKQSIGTVISGTTFQESRKGRKVEFIGVPIRSKTTIRKKKRKKRSKRGEERPLLDQGSCSCSCTCSDSDSSDDRLKHLESPVLKWLRTIPSTVNTSNHKPGTSTSEKYQIPKQSFSVIGTDTRSDIKLAQALLPEIEYSNVHQIGIPNASSSPSSEGNCNHNYVKMMVPELDLSSLTSTPRSQKNYVSNIFGNVKYDEVSESPKSTSSSGQRSPSNIPNKSNNSNPENISSTSKNNVDKNVSTKSKLDVGVSAKSLNSKPLSNIDVDEAEPSTSKIDMAVSATPIDSYKFEENQRKKVKQYYKAVKDIPSTKSEEKKSGKFMKFVQKIVPKRKKNSDILPLYSKESIEEEVELQTYNYPQDLGETRSSTTLNSAILRQSAANRENYNSSEEEEEERFRGGESGGIRNFRPILSYRALKNTNALPIGRSYRVTRDVLERYFVSIEDLTPTRDSDIPMTTLESPSFCGCRRANIQERPERDTTQKKDGALYHKTSGVRLTSSGISTENIKATSSSNLSEDFCTSVLGVPCSIGDFRTAESASGFISCSANPHEHLTVIPEIVITEDNTPVAKEERHIDKSKLTVSPKRSFTAKQRHIDQSEPTASPKRSFTTEERHIDKSEPTASPKRSFTTEERHIDNSEPTANPKRSFTVEERHSDQSQPTPSPKTSFTIEERHSDQSQPTPSPKTSFTIEERHSDRSQPTASPRRSFTSRSPICVSKHCNCELSEQQDRIIQTCPSILKPRRSTATVKSASAASTPSVYCSPQGTSNEIMEKPVPTSDKRVGTTDNNLVRESSMEQPVRTVDKIVETSEKYPVRDSKPKIERGVSTSDKMQQTSENSIYNISMIAGFDESSETMELSSYESQSQNRHPQFKYSCCKCPPTPPRYEDFVNLRDMEYGAVPRKSCPGYIEKYSKYPEAPSEYSTRSAPRPVSSRRKHVEYPSDNEFCIRERQYREPAESYPPESYPRRQKPEHAKPKQKVENIIICSCNGDCRSCNKKRKSQPAQYQSFRYKSSSSSEFEDEDEEEEDEEDEEEEEDYGEDNKYEPHTNRHDLPYQSGDDYMDLVQELEETLQCRNRNRVRRAMQEFEHRSRYNKPLEKPIINYDETSESEEPIIRKISQLTSDKKRCCMGDKCTCKKESRQRPTRDKKPQPQPAQRFNVKPTGGRPPQMSPAEGSKTRWQMDINSGEWYKVTGKPQRYNRDRRRSRTPSPRRPCPHDCSCCGTKKYGYRY